MRRQLTLMDPYLAGDHIKEVQRALGFKGKAVDGLYGPDTAGAGRGVEVAGRLSEAPDQQPPRPARARLALRRGAVPRIFRAERQGAEGEAVCIRERHHPPALDLSGLR